MNDIFIKRHSKRAFLDKPVAREILNRILEVARWAPSCMNNQPWRFIVIDDQEVLPKIHEGLNKGNMWATKAPVIIVVIANPKHDYTRQDDPVPYHIFGCGLAVENLLLAAVSEGLMGHPMAGYKAPKIKETLKILDEYHVVTVIALGYEGDISQLDEETRKKDEAARTRKPLSEIVFYNKFSN